MRSDIEGQLAIPIGMKTKLETYQRIVRRVKIAEGVLAAVFGLVISYILVFTLDRFMDTSALLRGVILLAGAVGLGVFFPLKLHKWVWGTSRMEQVARLMRHKFPRTSDRLLGIVELARSEAEQTRSRTLVKAAMKQVDDSIKDRDFSDAVPKPRHFHWAGAVAIPAVLVIAAVAFSSDATSNAFVRWLMPWKDTERYTFAKANDLPEQIVVPYAEKFDVNAKLRDDTKWSPESGSATYNNQKTVRANLKNKGYDFTIPPQKEAGSLAVSIGDIRESIKVTPMSRPELKSLDATYTLPAYLQYSSDQIADVRGGAISLLKGSEVHFDARVSREVSKAEFDGQAQRLEQTYENLVLADLPGTAEKQPTYRIVSWKKSKGDYVRAGDVVAIAEPTDGEKQKENRIEVKATASGVMAEYAASVSKLTAGAVIGNVLDQRVVTTNQMVSEDSAHDLAWNDIHGLQPQAPFRLKISAMDDAPPIISCELSSGRRVLLESDVVTFNLNVNDDFGVKVVGMEWMRLEDRMRRGDDPEMDDKAPFPNERVIAGGAPETRDINTVATFSGKTENIQPQSLVVRIFSEDYLKDRRRSYSAEYTLHILSPNDHFAWMTERMSRWLRQAEGVYEQELQLHDRNREFRRMEPSELNDPKTRRKLAQQAAAERANSARLGALTAKGKQMIEEATRNEQFQVGHLETWAEMMQKLEKLAENKMPSVSDLLDNAAKAKGQAKPSEGGKQDKSKSPPQAGENKGNQSGKGGKDDEEKKEDGPEKKAPSLSDVESGMNKQDDKAGDDEGGKKPTKGKFGLPTTMLQGGPPSEPESCPPQKDVDKAVEEQAEILAEFEDIKDALNEVMGELENSTFVKRLKAASRKQLEVASELNRSLFKGFGVEKKKLDERNAEKGTRIAKREEKQSENVYMIQQDLEAYFNRKQEVKFKEILDDMSDSRVVTKLRGLSDRIRENRKGESIARAEYWADTLDRWAEEMVQPSPGGA